MKWWIYAVCIGVAVSWIWLGFYSNSMNIDEPPFFEPFASDDDMWANIMAAYPNYDAMTDLQKTTALRTWASQHMYVSGPVNVYNHNLFDNEHPYLIFNHFSAFHNGEAGVMCSGHAHALSVLYNYAGFPSLKYDYGGDGCSHSITLVRIMDAGAPKIIVQDAYFDYYYAWPNGTAMSVYEVFAEVNTSRDYNVVPVYEKTIDYGVLTPISDDIKHLYGFEEVTTIDHDSVVYRFWHTPERYATVKVYADSKIQEYGPEVTDADLIVEDRLIVYFGNGTTDIVNDFSVLEGGPV